MEKSYKQLNTHNASAEDEWCRFLCVNKTQPQYNFDDNNFSLPNETISALGELGEVLSGIHNRMKKDGYDIENGMIVKTT